MSRFIHEPAVLSYADLPTVNDNGRRMYCTPEGERFPSITTVLGASGKESIKAWRDRIGHDEADRIARLAAARGTGMHNISEKYVRGDVDFMTRSTMPHYASLFNAIRPVIDANLEKVYAQETPLYSKYLKVAGRVDLVGKYRGKNSVIDFKTASKPKLKEWIINYFQQASFYAIAFEECTGIPIPQIVIIMAVDGSPTPIEFVERRNNYTDGLIATINNYYSLYA
jgi:CRISPR/Cas system-associated exonuclease Cas4 (RecB family)